MICGLVVGLNSVLVPLYIYEISPTQVRPAMLAINQVMIAAGIAASYFLETIIRNNLLDPYKGINQPWRLLFLISVAPCLLRILIFLFY